MQKARIRLSSIDLNALKAVCRQLESVCAKTGIKKYGPVPLPTKRLRVPVLKAPSGQGTATWAKFEMRIHKRLFEIITDEKTMHLFMKIKIPESVLVEIELM